MAKNNKILIWITLITLLLGIGLIITLNPLEQAVLTECIGGATLTSIDTTYQTSSSNLGGKEAIRVTATANKGGECAQIVFEADNIKSQLNDGAEEFLVDNSVFGDVVLQSLRDTFQAIRRVNEPVYRIQETRVDNEQECKDLASQNNALYLGIVPQLSIIKDYCYIGEVAGQRGVFGDSSGFDFDVLFKIDGLGETILNKNAQVATLGDKAYIKFDGFKLGFSWQGKPTNYEPYWSINSFGFVLVDSGSYTSARDKLAELTTEINDESADPDIIQSKMNSYNSFIDSLEVSKIGQYINEEIHVKNALLDGNTMTVGLVGDILFPTFVIDLDADFVGIHKLETKPQVSCPADFQFFADRTEQKSVQVKNIGNNAGSMGFAISCTNGGVATLSVNRETFNTGETKSIDAYHSITVSEEENTKDSVCTFRAYDLNNLNNEDTCSYDFTGEYKFGCTEGTLRCSDDFLNILECTNENFILKQQCEFGCEPYQNTVRCKITNTETDCQNSIDDDADGKIDCEDLDCKDATVCREDGCEAWVEIQGKTIIPDLWCLLNKAVQDAIRPVSIGLAILVSLMVLLYGRSLTQEFNIKQDALTWGSIIIISAIAGFIVYYVSQTFWWVSAIILIILLIVKVIL